MSTPIAHTTTASSASSSSSKRSMSIPMPPNNFVHPSPAVTYVLATSPTPTQNPENSSWLPHAFHMPGTVHHTASHGFHISTPHPLAAATSFLDKHVPIFAKHHAELSYGHAARQAKREARRSLTDSPIPEVDMEELARRGGVTAATAADKTHTAHERTHDQVEWARDGNEHASGSESGEEKSPAITP